MTERGGAATQTGIYYQNSVAALALLELLELGDLFPRERAVEVRVESPGHVDDIVIIYADGHRDYQSVKLSLQLGTNAWDSLWRSLNAQQLDSKFGELDQLTILVAERNSASDAVMQLCERAASSIDRLELVDRLTSSQTAALSSIGTLVGDPTAAFELLRRVRVLHRPEDSIEGEVGRRRLGGSTVSSSRLLGALRDLAGGTARRRGLFHPVTVRRSLRVEYDISLGEPANWGVTAYRSAIRRLATIEIPGTSISGPAADFFVWPRARQLDATRPKDFETEIPELSEDDEDTGIDLKTFPSDALDRVVVVAGPGHGKSVLLTALASELADSIYVPVLVPLASLAAADVNVIEFLSTTMRSEYAVNADWERLAEQGLLVLMFDGLDEVPSAQRPVLMARVSRFSARFPQAPWMLTVRDATVLRGLSQRMVIELLPLNDEDIESFAGKMQRFTGDMAPWEVARRLRLYPDVDRLARIPLFLVLLLATTDLDDPKPMKRADLIETYLSTLFSPERNKATGAHEDRSVVLRSIAETLAFERLEQQEIGATEREVREVVKRFADDSRDTETLLERLRSNGILKLQGAIRLVFPYPIVQEFLAARHLVECFPDSLARRIDDAVQRPWAQVIQFALELSNQPAPVIEAMLERPDDAFATGLRLVGRCIANGARVSEELRLRVGERLVRFWSYAPSNSRDRVGRVLADGFAFLDSEGLRAALHYPWLIEHGAGDVLSRRRDNQLTLSVLRRLITENGPGRLYRSLRVALSAAGNPALLEIVGSMRAAIHDADRVTEVSSLLENLTPSAVSRDLVIEVARDQFFPRQARLRAYELAGAPLEDGAVSLAMEAFRDEAWDENYAAADLISLHAAPSAFLDELLRDRTITSYRRTNIAASVGFYVADPDARSHLVHRLALDTSIDEEVRVTLRLMDARYGNGQQFESLVNDIPHLNIDQVAYTIAIFGHFPVRELAERAATLTRARATTPVEIIRISHAVITGMRYIFEMSFGFGGVLRSAPPHPGIASWLELLEDWSIIPELDAPQRIVVRTSAAALGSASMAATLEGDLLAIEDFDDPIWQEDDDLGHTLSRALDQIRRRIPTLPTDFIERVLRSERYNIASHGVTAIADRSDVPSLEHLLILHSEMEDRSLRDFIANKIEALAALLQLVVQKDGSGYRLA